jgi:hypothetical protein
MFVIGFNNVLSACMHAGGHSHEHPVLHWIGPWTQFGPNAGTTFSRQTKHLNVFLGYLYVILRCCKRHAAPQMRPSHWQYFVIAQCRRLMSTGRCSSTDSNENNCNVFVCKVYVCAWAVR